jgi:hypothetical protein
MTMQIFYQGHLRSLIIKIVIFLFRMLSQFLSADAARLVIDVKDLSFCYSACIRSFMDFGTDYSRQFPIHFILNRKISWQVTSLKALISMSRNCSFEYAWEATGQTGVSDSSAVTASVLAPSPAPSTAQESLRCERSPCGYWSYSGSHYHCPDKNSVRSGSSFNCTVRTL